jgi:protein-tyrosine phosphatase
MSSTQSVREKSTRDAPGDRRAPRWIVGLTLIAAGIAVSIFAWDTLKYRFIPKRWGVVVPGLVYRSGQISKWMLEKTLTEHNIATIVDLQGIDPASEDQKHEIAAAERLPFELLRFPLAGDGTGDVVRYADAVEAVARAERAGKPVLVHCAAGSQRTGGVVAFYRLLVRGDSPEAAMAELSRFDWDPETPLVGFLNAHMAEVAQMLVERGVIERAPEPLPELPQE